MTDVCYHDFPPYRPGVERVCRHCKMPADVFRAQVRQQMGAAPVVSSPAPVADTKKKRRQLGSRPEKLEQQRIVNLLESIGAIVFEIGRPRQQKCHHCGVQSKDLGTRQTPGIPDLFVFLPFKKLRGPFLSQQYVWIEMKGIYADGRIGTLSQEQRDFRDACHARGIPHVDGIYEDVYRWLADRHFVEAA